MSIANKLLDLWAAERAVSSTGPLFTRLIMGMVAVTLFAGIAIILVIALLIGGAWFAHGQLLSSGVSPRDAGILIGTAAFGMLAYALFMIRSCIRRIKETSKQIIYLQDPIAGHLSSLVQSFLDGFSATSPQK